MSRAPLRISFFGGGTDYPEYFLEHGGAVLGSAINKYSYVTANTFWSKLFDYKIRVSYSTVELVKKISEIKHPVVREALRLLGIKGDIELHNVADLPAFSGLGSSSTFTVSLLQALHAFKGERISGLQLAYEAIHLERNILKESVGCQDQTFAAVGGFNLIEFVKEDQIFVHRVPITPQRLYELEQYLILFFTNIKRRASVIAESQIKRVKKNKDTLKEMRQMVDIGFKILTTMTPIEEFGLLLHKAWQAKRTLASSVSNPHIDKMYASALEAGAIGGKITGAGGGGFMLLFVPPEKRIAVKRAFADYQEIPISLNAEGASVII
ncbi:MAG: GHMP kinase [Candidatus Dadabacteria bacterium]|nr:MAG: GHMP kinase [Candidatus Dadabacteria bacterium]